MKCPSCGARNPESARWCGQCLQRFDVAVEKDARAPAGDVASGTQQPPVSTISTGQLPGSGVMNTPVGQSVQASRPQPASAYGLGQGASPGMPLQVIEVAASGIALPSLDFEGTSSGATPWPTEAASEPVAVPQAGATGSSATDRPDVAEVPRYLPAPDAAAVVAPLASSMDLASQRSVPMPAPAVGRSPAGTAVQARSVPRPGRAENDRTGRTGRLSPSALPHAVERDPLGGLVLRCAQCGASNSVEATECKVCGFDFFAALREAQKPMVSVEPRTALLWGLLPGGGYFPLKMPARFVGHFLLVAWLIFLAFIVSPKDLVFFRVVFALGAASVWSGSAIDAHRRARSDAEFFFPGKRALYVFMASLALLFSMGFVLTFSLYRKQQGSPDAGGGTTVIEVPADQGGDSPLSGAGTDGGAGPGSSVS